MAATANVGSGNRQTTRAAKAIQGWPDFVKILTVSTSFEEGSGAKRRGRRVSIACLSAFPGIESSGGFSGLSMGMAILSPDRSKSEIGGAGWAPVFIAKSCPGRRQFKASWFGIAVKRAYSSYTVSLGGAASAVMRSGVSDMPKHGDDALRASLGV